MISSLDRARIISRLFWIVVVLLLLLLLLVVSVVVVPFVFVFRERSWDMVHNVLYDMSEIRRK